ncbi:MAG: hypothetical protein QXH91_06235 [Candidatus Bathyarchaeia archaeon]
MGKVVTGIKAGVIAGVIYSIILAPFTYFTLVLFKEDIISIIMASLPEGYSLTAEEIFSFALLIAIISVFIVGIILGVIVGLIYGWAYEKIPGRTAIIKGIIFGIILWLIFSVILGFGNLGYGVTYYLYSLVGDLIAYLIFGLLLGYFYNRFTLKTVE